MATASLRKRLIVASILWIALGTGLAALALSQVFRHHLNQQFREELMVHLEELEGLTSLEGVGPPRLTRPLSDPRYALKGSGYYWEIRNGSSVIANSPSLANGSILPHPHTGEDGQLHFHQFAGPTGELLLAERIIPRAGVPLRFMVGTDLRHIESVMSAFHSTLLIAMAAFATSLMVAAGLLLVFALRPLAQLRGDLAVVRSGAADRLKDYYPSEVQPVIEDLNGLLASTRKSVEMARAQAGNLAHGLKTPLAVVIDEAYSLSAAGQSRAAEVIVEQCHRMELHINYQLARARAAGARANSGTVSWPRPVAEAACSALRRLYGERSVALENRIDPNLAVACDAQDLNEMLANLIDNGCKHAATRVVISNAPADNGRMVRILVEDDGHGLPP
ncbi:MAG: sensor histidine kinase, partial [Proteobacteria bacterium]|nr:sensor histidine kinase [Pseudomonadota bacterium]